MGLGDFPPELGRDDRLHHRAVGRESPLLFPPAQEVGEKEDAQLISREAPEDPVGPADEDAEPVGVGVGRQNEIGLELVCPIEREAKDFLLLGVGNAHGREVSVRISLFGDEENFGKPLPPENGLYRPAPVPCRGV